MNEMEVDPSQSARGKYFSFVYSKQLHIYLKCSCIRKLCVSSALIRAFFNAMSMFSIINLSDLTAFTSLTGIPSYMVLERW